ncbi:uncharacterized protein LOC144444652 [Glandiceps talaboti]
MAEARQPERPGLKQAIKVYAKLQSFGKAQEEIMSKLCKMFNERIDNKTMTIDKCLYGDDPEIVDEFDTSTVTAVVAIDARQTRVLVTPTRADPAVDHWDELKHLAEKVTKPKGSIIIIIYGDEKSKNLPKDEIIAGEWKLCFQFNDESAPHPILNDRCFSLWEDFSERQKLAMSRYFYELALFPSTIDKPCNVLVIGDEPQLKIFEKILKSHAFLHMRDRPNTFGHNWDIKELYHPHFNTGEHVSVTLYCAKTDDGLPIQICNKEKIVAYQCRCSSESTSVSQKQLSLCTQCFFEDARQCDKNTTEKPPPENFYYLRMIYNKTTETASNILLYPFRYVVPTIDRVIVLCHDCVKCFTEISDERHLVGSNLQRCLEKGGISIDCDVYPLILNVSTLSNVHDEVSKRMLKTILSFMKEEDFKRLSAFEESPTFEERSTILTEQAHDIDWMTKLYTMYLCHGGFLFPENAVIEDDTPVGDTSENPTVNNKDALVGDATDDKDEKSADVTNSYVKREEDRAPENVHEPEGTQENEAK